MLKSGELIMTVTKPYRFRIALVLFFIILIIVPAAMAKSSDIALNFKDADIKDAFRALADQAGVNIVIDSQVSGAVTIHISKVSFADALNILCKNNGLIYTKDNNQVYNVTKPNHALLKVDYREGLLSVEARDIPLKQLWEEISRQTGRGLVPAPEMDEKIAILLNRVPLDDAIQTILLQANCVVEPVGKASFIRKKTAAQLGLTVKYEKGLLTVDADNVDAGALFNEIARQAATNIMVDRTIQANLSVHLKGVSLESGLAAIADSQGGWVVEKQSQYYYIHSNANQNQNQNMKVAFNSKTGRFDMDIQTAPLAAILYEMARKADLNLVVLSQVNWTVNNLRLRGQSVEQSLKLLLAGTFFTFMKNDGTYVIGDSKVIRPENADFAVVKIYPVKYLKSEQLVSTLPPHFPRQDFIQLADKNAVIVTAPQEIHEMFAKYLAQIDVATIEDHTELIKVKYAKAEDIVKNMPPSLPRTDIVVIKEQNALVVTGPQNVTEQVRQYVEKIDKINPMIVFDIQVVQITNDNNTYWNKAATTSFTGKELGKDNKLTIDATNGLLTLSKINDTVTSIANINALISKGKAKILANPTISALNGYQASFSVSTKRNYNVVSESVVTGTNTSTVTETTKTYDSGLYFTITPWVSANNQITMEVKPKYSEFGTTPGSDLPSTYERAVETTIRVDDKQTVVIGGLKRRNMNKTVSRIPILGSIPLIGNLFKSYVDEETQDEFVIIITPYLTYDDAAKSGADQKVINGFDPEIKESLPPALQPRPQRMIRNEKSKAMNP
jgi:type II secretory pathway component GspD/PulD (secretin)